MNRQLEQATAILLLLFEQTEPYPHYVLHRSTKSFPQNDEAQKDNWNNSNNNYVEQPLLLLAAIPF